MRNTIQSNHLEYQLNGSDKLYNIALIEDTLAEQSYIVTAHYGRRGNVLQNIEKSRHYTLAQAQVSFNSLLNEKLRKGYTSTTVRTVNTDSKKKAKIEPPETQREHGERRITFEL